MRQIWNASSGVSTHENITVSRSWKICDDLGWSGSVKNCGVHEAIWVHHPTAFQLAPPAISSLCSTADQRVVTARPSLTQNSCTTMNHCRSTCFCSLFRCEPVLCFSRKTFWRPSKRPNKTTCWNTCSFVPCVTRECDELLLNAKS